MMSDHLKRPIRFRNETNSFVADQQNVRLFKKYQTWNIQQSGSVQSIKVTQSIQSLAQILDRLWLIQCCLLGSSDGVGRTGTYCLLDMVLNRMSKGTSSQYIQCIETTTVIVLAFRYSTSLLGEPGSPSSVVPCGCACLVHE